MCTLAVHWGWLDTVPGFPDRLRENPPRQGFFEHPEYLAVRAHLPAPWQDILDLAYYSGWRKNEILGLTWDEIDEAGSVIRLAPARSKTLRGRILPIAPPIAEALARREATSRRVAINAFFLSSVGRLVPLGGLEAVAVPVGRQHGGMVHDAVDDGRGGGRIQEHLGPAGERQIGRHDQAPALVAAADEAEQQVGAGPAGASASATSRFAFSTFDGSTTHNSGHVSVSGSSPAAPDRYSPWM